MVKSPPTSALEVLLLLPSLLLQISPHGFLRLHYSFSLLIFSITHCIKHVHMHYMQGSNVATLVFVCVRVVTAGCDRAIRMHQDGSTLSPSSCIHRSPPSASSFSFSSPPFLPFISFPTLCSSFHSCFVLFFPPPIHISSAAVYPLITLFFFFYVPAFFLPFSSAPHILYPVIHPSFSPQHYIFTPHPPQSPCMLSHLSCIPLFTLPLSTIIFSLFPPPPLWRHPSSGSSSKARIYILIYQFPAAVEAVMDGVLPAPQRCHELPW